MTGAEPTHIYLNPVREDRAADFEDWVRSVLVPAVTEHRPEQQGRWRVLRAIGGDDVEKGTVLYAFVLSGGDLSEWDLESLFERALSADGAERALETWNDMLERPQYGWTFEPLPLG